MIKLPAYRITSPTEGLVVVEPSSGETCITADYHELLRYLLHSADPIPYTVPRVVWNLAEFFNLVKSMLPKLYVTDLDSDKHRADWYEGSIHYRLFYQPSKFFGIHAGGWGEETTYYELDQFFPDDPILNSASDLQTKADELVQAFASLGVHKIDNLKSPVATIEASGMLDTVYKSLPSPKDIPDGCKEYATLSDAWGAWTSAYQIGRWKAGECHSYDMASCYPSIASRLLSLEGADYLYSKKWIDSATYAFVKGTLYIDPSSPYAFCSPVVSSANDRVTNPTGKLKGVFTSGQVKYIERHNMGNFDLKDGWFINVHSGVRPLEPIMSSLYKRRSESELMSMIAKRIIAGIIGRLGEWRQNMPTEYTNPVYHSLIRNSASLLVGEFLIANNITKDELVAVNTDGCHITRDLALPENVAMGKWRHNGSEQLLVVSDDKVYEGDRADWLLDEIKANPRSTKYADLDLFSIIPDRYFKKLPSTGSELLRKHYLSAPVCLSDNK